MLHNEKPTGRKRYRTAKIGLFERRKVLVLQIEVSHGDGPLDHHGLPEYLAGTYWRDARVEDITAKEPE